MTVRDFAAEMRAVIDAETSHGPYVSRVIAREIVEKLEANDAELLDGWLREHAEQLVWQAINDRDRSMRSSARATSSRSAFAAAANAAEGGDGQALGRFLSCPYVTEDGSRLRLAELTHADLLFVAKGYDAQSKQAAMEAAFFAALARKVRKGTVADHFTEERIAELRRSLG
jgi:hypothetical protein